MQKEWNNYLFPPSTMFKIEDGIFNRITANEQT